MSDLSINKGGEEGVKPQESADPNKIGESEHDKEMMALADKANGEDTGNQEARPEWLPEKFKSPEDMAKAYSELEKKLGAPKEEEGTNEGNDEGTKEEVGDNKSGIDFDALGKEVAENGELSEESLKALTDMGLPKEVVDFYVESAKNQASQAQQVNQETISKFYDAAGGEESFTKIAEWAGKEGDKSLVEAYDRALNAGDADTALILLDNIKQGYIKANGSEGISVSGTTTNSTGDVYESWAQVSADMNDPRYGNDPAYVKQVEQKLTRSKNLN